MATDVFATGIGDAVLGRFADRTAGGAGGMGADVYTAGDEVFDACQAEPEAGLAAGVDVTELVTFAGGVGGVCAQALKNAKAPATAVRGKNLYMNAPSQHIR